MSTGRRVNRDGPMPRNVLRSLRSSYATANRHASDLARAYRNNPLALIDLQGEIERRADKANAIALRIQTRADGKK